MTLTTNNAEGGFNGNTVTTAQNMSGAPLIAVNKGVGVTIFHDSAQKAHGALSYHFTGPVSTLGTITFPGAAAAASYATRFYIRFNTLAPTALMRLPSAIGWKLAGASNNQFAVANDLGATIFTFAGTITTGVWYRLELEATKGTTTSNGYIAARYFLGDATTPVETQFSSNAVNAGTGTFAANVDFGNISLSTAFDLFLDDLAANDGTTTPIGPAAEGPTARSSGVNKFYLTPARAVSASRSWTLPPTYSRTASVSRFSLYPGIARTVAGATRSWAGTVPVVPAAAALTTGQLWPRGKR